MSSTSVSAETRLLSAANGPHSLYAGPHRSRSQPISIRCKVPSSSKVISVKVAIPCLYLMTRSLPSSPPDKVAPLAALCQRSEISSAPASAAYQPKSSFDETSLNPPAGLVDFAVQTVAAKSSSPEPLSYQLHTVLDTLAVQNAVKSSSSKLSPNQVISSGETSPRQPLPSGIAQAITPQPRPVSDTLAVQNAVKSSSSKLSPNQVISSGETSPRQPLSSGMAQAVTPQPRPVSDTLAVQNAVKSSSSKLSPNQVISSGETSPRQPLSSGMAQAITPQPRPVSDTLVVPNAVKGSSSRLSPTQVISSGETSPRQPHSSGMAQAITPQPRPVSDTLAVQNATAKSLTPQLSPRQLFSSGTPQPPLASTPKSSSAETAPSNLSQLSFSPTSGAVVHSLVVDSIHLLTKSINARIYKAHRIEPSPTGFFLRDVILKVNRNDPYQTEAINIEKFKAKGVKNVIDLIDYFNGCLLNRNDFTALDDVMVLPYAGETLYRFAKTVSYDFNVVLKITKQLLESLKGICSLNMIHGDLTSNNICLNENFDIKLIDFLNATEIHDNISDPTALWWRAPEFFIKAKINASIDMFSLGCVLYQFATGATLFPSNWYPIRNDQRAVDMLHMNWIVSRLGIPPENFLKNGEKTENFFKKEGAQMAFKEDLITKLDSWKICVHSALIKKGASEIQANQFLAFMERLLAYENRISAADALKLPLFS